MSDDNTMVEPELSGSMPVPFIPGRLIDRPELSGYQIKSVVDWIDVEFTVACNRSVYPLRRQLNASRVDELTAKRTVGTQFRARIQDPSSAFDLRSRLALVGAIDARITGIEIAVDLYPLSPDAKAGMGTMCAHLLRGLKNPLDFARFWREGPGIDQLQSFEATIRQFESGRTCYLGHRGDRHQQRIYLKRTNDSNTIPESEHRVRIENTYFAPEGFAGVLDGLLADLVGRNDFAFRRMSTPATTMMPMTRLLVSRVAQAGARVLRSNRRLYDPNTKADTQLNRRVYDSLRSLYTRWEATPRAAEIAGQISPVSLCGDAPSDYYTSVSTDCQAVPKQSEPEEGVSLVGDASKVEERSAKSTVNELDLKGTGASTSLQSRHRLGQEGEQTGKHRCKVQVSSLAVIKEMKPGKHLTSVANMNAQKPLVGLIDSMRSTLSSVMTIMRSGSSKLLAKVCTVGWSVFPSSMGFRVPVVAGFEMSRGKSLVAPKFPVLLYTRPLTERSPL